MAALGLSAREVGPIVHVCSAEDWSLKIRLFAAVTPPPAPRKLPVPEVRVTSPAPNTLVLKDIEPVVLRVTAPMGLRPPSPMTLPISKLPVLLDRKSTRLNSSHANTSYAVFC